MTRRRTDSGFTLIEVLLALAIFAFVTTIMLGSFTQTAKRAHDSFGRKGLVAETWELAL